MKKKLFYSHRNQCNRVDEIYAKLRFNSLDDFLTITQRQFYKHGGKSLLEYYYASDYKKLLQTLYPNYPWDFTQYWQNTHTHFQSIGNQRAFLDSLYDKFELRCFEDWMNVSKEKIIKQGGKSLLSKYSNDINKLLSALYPHYPWDFSSRKVRGSLSQHDAQYAFMERLYSSLQLCCFEDWCTLQYKVLLLHGGRFLYHAYSNNLHSVLLNLYPNYPWSFVDGVDYSADYFNDIDNQRDYLDYLFYSSKFKSLGDFGKVIRSKAFFRHRKGWAALLSVYNQNAPLALSSIYPHYPWQFSSSLSNENQRKYLTHFIAKMKLSSLDDLLFISKVKYLKYCYRGDRMLKKHNYDVRKLLLSVFPHHPWQFDNIKYRPHKDYYKSSEYLKDKLKVIQKRYSIKQLEDWYRLPIITHQINLFSTLQTIYPNIEWEKSSFYTKSKKVSQRLLRIRLQQMFHRYYFLENYRHPLLYHRSMCELDIYYPALSLAFEYQGEHHYDDLVQGLGQLELHQTRDESKQLLAEQLHIRLVRIPFWWDHSLSSLFAVIRHSLLL